MSTSFWRSPHEGGSSNAPHAPNAALLIDFDNVTMGMRSDLAKELKTLLDSDIIKGKVTVQRAYADWRRYPQYIVPLSEASIDLIFAPAYGSSKKNATDIRMAIDGMELIFIRPEIGTFILLTGDSDFSSLVLKLKEYGKYVIGIGIQESSSDILVQNCDEYYSYTSIAGLRKTTDLDQVAMDPWMAVEQAIQRMVSRGDVMRSDRLKQVMLEIDPGFDEKGYGFSKFSKFLAEASSKGLVNLKKLENGQYEVSPSRGEARGDSRGRKPEGRRGRKEREGKKSRKPERPEQEPSEVPEVTSEGVQESEGDPLTVAYDLLRTALAGFGDEAREGVRDSDVKRKMLAIDRGFDEAELGFGKFSRFLKQAHDHGVVILNRRDSGNFEVLLADGASAGTDLGQAEESETGASQPAQETRAEGRPSADQSPASAPSGDTARERTKSGSEGGGDSSRGRRTVGLRRGSQGRHHAPDKPPILEGQVVQSDADKRRGARSEGGARSHPALAGMDLPTEARDMVQYLTGYKGVGRKTAESLVEAFGADLFRVFHEHPERLSEVVPARRAEQVLDAWTDDYAFRLANAGPEGPTAKQSSRASEGRRTRRGTRRGAGRRKSSRG